MLKIWKAQKINDKSWPFKEPAHAAVFTTAEIIEGKEDILYVSRDAEDDDWEFIGSTSANEDNGKLVSLSEVALIDNTIFQLSNLKPGWIAERENLNDPWKRSKFS